MLTSSVSGATSPLLVGVAQLPSDAATLPAAIGGVNACSGLIWQARSAAYVSESRVPTGTPLWSPTYLARSAKARCAASMTRCCTCAGRQRLQVVALEDVERLADGGAAAGGRRHAVDVEPAVADVGGPVLDDVVLREVLRPHLALGHRQVGAAAHRRLADGLGQLAGQVAAVERADAALREQVVGVGEVGVADRLPTFGALPCRRNSLRVEVKVLNRSALSSVCWLKVLSTLNPLRASVGRRREDVGQGHRAPAVERGLPGGRGAGDADRDAAGDQVGGEGVGLAGGRVDERVVLHRGRRGLAAVERLHLLASSRRSRRSSRRRRGRSCRARSRRARPRWRSRRRPRCRPA